MQNKKILIIGGTGFIGYHLSKRCLKLNWAITSISLNRPKKIRKLKNIKYLRCNISKKKKLDNLLKNKKFDYVVNLGGYVDHLNKKKVFESHYIGVKNLFSTLRDKNIFSFIQIGSSNEYGNNRSPHNENMYCKPKMIYGKYKNLATNFLLNCYKKYHFPVTVIRFYQLYGPGQDLNRFIPQLIFSCLNKEKFYTSTGEQSRDFLYIDDAVDAIIKSIKNKNSKGKIINKGSGKPIKLKKIMKIVEKKIKNFNPVYNKLRLRRDEPKIVYPNKNLAKKILIWSDRISFNKGIKKTINYYKKSFV